MSSATAKVADGLIDYAAGLQQTDDFDPDLDRREHERHPYRQAITVTLITPEGHPGTPVTVNAMDISQGGICIESRTMFRPGAVGTASLPRSDGRSANVGIQVCHCRYVGRMMHRTGLRFIPLPE